MLNMMECRLQLDVGLAHDRVDIRVFANVMEQKRNCVTEIGSSISNNISTILLSLNRRVTVTLEQDSGRKSNTPKRLIKALGNLSVSELSRCRANVLTDETN